MKITFVAPNLNLSGGLRVIATYADKLKHRGHDVTVVSPNKQVSTLKKRIRSFLKGTPLNNAPFCTDFFKDSDVNLIILDKHRPVLNEDVPDADIVIATYWNTAEWIHAFSPAKGKKFYFIQGHEAFHFLPMERVKETYRLPFHKIVVSQWLVDIMKDTYGVTDVSLVENGVDPLLFNAAKRQKSTTPTVGVVYSDSLKIKGCDTVFDSISLARKYIPQLKLIAFSTKEPSSKLPLPENTEFFLSPEQHKIKDIYGMCDAWLFGSRNEGFGLPILEAMACRTPVIGTKAGAAPELLKDGSGFLVDIDDANAMSDAIVKVCKMNEDEWQALSDNAYQTSQNYHWDKKVAQFEKVLETFVSTR